MKGFVGVTETDRSRYFSRPAGYQPARKPEICLTSRAPSARMLPFILDWFQSNSGVF